MLGLHRAGVTLIILAILIPPLAIWGPIPYFHLRYKLGYPGPNFVMHDHAYERYLTVAYTMSIILVGFGILFLRDAARKRSASSEDSAEQPDSLS